MVPDHPCSALCVVGTHVDLVWVSPGLVDPGPLIARHWEQRYGVEVVEVRPAYEAPRPWEIHGRDELAIVNVVGSGQSATEPWMVRWQVGHGDHCSA